MLNSIVVARLWWLRSGLRPSRKNSGALIRWRIVVGPFALGAISLTLDALNAIADLGTRVRSYRSFNGAFVVIDEKARRCIGGQPLPHRVEFQRGRDCVGGTAADTSLVIDFRALITQINARSDLTNYVRWNCIAVVSLVGQISFPAVACDLTQFR
jgi:hypothetical protein